MNLLKQIEFCCRRLLKTTAVLAVLGSLIATDAMAQSKADYLAGKELFTREWEYEAPMQLARREGMSDKQYEAELEKLAGDGLGPMHNATSCEACHAQGGGAGVDRNVTLLTIDPRSPTIKMSARLFSRGLRQSTELLEPGKQIDDLFPGFIAGNGRLSMDIVVHESSTRPGYETIRQKLADGVSGGIDPKWYDRNQRTSQAIAQTPVIAGRKGGLDYYLSQRNSPPLFGLGLIDQIPMARLRTTATTQKKRSRGEISGRPGNGKFGWRAQTPSLSAFVAGACAGELGLRVEAPQFRTGFSTPAIAQPPDMADSSYVSLGADIESREFDQLVSYVAGLPAPDRHRSAGTTNQSWMAADIRKGKTLFGAIGCNDCHVETVLPARGIYSDLLLHDMGASLQAPSPSSALTTSSMRIPTFPRENRRLGSGPSIASYYGGGVTPRAYELERPLFAQFPYGKVPDSELNPEIEENALWDTLQREWRTPPLWGVADSAPYLHDGRATTLDAAIRWHAGEASKSAEKYRSLDDNDRKLVLSFLKSLRAPVRSAQQSVRSEQEKWFDDQILGAAGDKSTTQASDKSMLTSIIE